MAIQVAGPLLCWGAYVVSIVSAAVASGILDASTTLGVLTKSLILDLLATAVVFVFSFATGNSSVYDPYWCIAPLCLGFYYKSHAAGGFWAYEPRETLCLIMLWAWAIRFFVGIPWDGWTIVSALHLASPPLTLSFRDLEFQGAND